MKVGDILRQKTARVATVRMNETVGIAAQLMRASNISALVVKDVVRTEGNTAAGMFTERDVVRAIAEHGAAGVNLKVSQLVSVQQLVSCCSTDTLEQARHLMNKNHIRHLPVIDNYTLIGVVSIRDISKAFDDEAKALARAVPGLINGPGFCRDHDRADPAPAPLVNTGTALLVRRKPSNLLTSVADGVSLPLAGARC